MPIIAIIIIILDQLTKQMAINSLKDSAGISIIGDFLRLTYVENRGAAFGILANQRLFFIVVTSIILIVIIGILVTRGDTLAKITKVSMYLIMSGAVGNLIDRVRFGYVVDFIDVRFGSLYNFPVFNIADMSIVIGTTIVTVLILFDRYEDRSSVIWKKR